MVALGLGPMFGDASIQTKLWRSLPLAGRAERHILLAPTPAGLGVTAARRQVATSCRLSPKARRADNMVNLGLQPGDIARKESGRGEGSP